jgi:ABC-2 type transport system ATP-binding protein
MGKQKGHLVVTNDPNDNVAIKVEGVSKSFRLPHNRQNSIKGSLINLVSRGDRTFETQEVLKDISFDIKKGEFFGIVGRNGSGKSTLLKMLAGIYTPTSGKIIINGSLTPFIELGVGFNPELTGRENVYMNGALLGFNEREVSAMYDDIVEFAELERFMDQKLKNYSSGMQVRLAFSIAIRARSDILLFDEVLAVGDAAFQQKCYETFDEIKESGTTVVLVTHDMPAVQRFCDKAILIEKGKIKFAGNPHEVADKYLQENFDGPKEDIDDEVDESIADVELLGGKGAINVKEDVRIRFKVSPEATPYHVGFQLFRNDGMYIFGTNTKNAGSEPLRGTHTFEVTLGQNLTPGTYTLTLALMNKFATSVTKYRPKLLQFTIKQQTNKQGAAILDDAWKIDGKEL